ncbi:GlsB/YeaQ/YmgE family stress response membrane protein [Winslowiella iniecta]|uniref:Membrane protein n=1 Tax=Winslowiella iniecta TaxID=1560201 RepID=A0A0L7T414_9GAMM|nr:membrane protein [Winslowiella iniecta]KOC89951.1 membrane protein [Winslowiella iniecta]KOC94355.1 membrane protein [Winslowiella iniecta]
MGIVSWIIIGLLVGFVARKFFPGRPGGLIPTLVLAMIGGLIGGYISSYFNWGSLTLLHPRALLFALLGSLLMLLVVKKLRL